jgi:exosortase D (VPLPA-CTERM-specific)
MRVEIFGKNVMLPNHFYWAFVGFFASILVFFHFRHGIYYTISAFSREEYSHGYLIPFVTMYLVWRKRHELASVEWRGSWVGFLIVALGLILSIVGEMATIYGVVRFAFLIVLFGIVLSAVGWKVMKHLAVPLSFLAFMIPLPSFVYSSLSNYLQLVSSEFGVFFIRLFGISVFLEGNVIDLGVYKLQVVEACSGLRYLFPLMSFGFLCAYLYRAPLWAKCIVFLCTIPASIFLNSFRIGVTGALVNWFGIEVAEGFLHDFEGWVIFLAGVGLLFLVMIVLARGRGYRGPLYGLIEFDPKPPPQRQCGDRGPQRAERLDVPASFVVASLLLVPVIALTALLDKREHIIPERASFASFPMKIGEWQGRREVLDEIYLPALKLDDYLLADFKRSAGDNPINLYIAYYASQRDGGATHSPAGCLPAGGWSIEQLDAITIPDVDGSGASLRTNRAVMAKGDTRLLVYYWFRERDRNLTNEYIVKFMIFWDALTRRQTNGALIRLVVPIANTTYPANEDETLRLFISNLLPNLRSYVPGS